MIVHIGNLTTTDPVVPRRIAMAHGPRALFAVGIILIFRRQYSNSTHSVYGTWIEIRFTRDMVTLCRNNILNKYPPTTCPNSFKFYIGAIHV